MLTQFHLYIFGLIVKFFFMKLTTLLELYQMFFCLSSTRNQDLTCGSILLIIILKDQGKKLKNSVTECSLSCPSNSAVLMQVPLHNIVWGNWGSNNTCCCSQGKLLGGLSFIKYISLLLIYICSLWMNMTDKVSSQCWTWQWQSGHLESVQSCSNWYQDQFYRKCLVTGTVQISSSHGNNKSNTSLVMFHSAPAREPSAEWNEN